jgi:hypothetical protein
VRTAFKETGHPGGEEFLVGVGGDVVSGVGAVVVAMMPRSSAAASPRVPRRATCTPGLDHASRNLHVTAESTNP